MIKIIFLLLISVSAAAQNKEAKNPWRVTGNDIMIISLQGIGGAADGLHERIVNHHYKQGNQFWDQELSWKNKYRNFDVGDLRPRFPGSKTYLVMITDGYHLTQSIDRGCMRLSLAISAGDIKSYAPKDRWKVIIKRLGMSIIANRLAFALTYK